jgi:hypothetical protein
MEARFGPLGSGARRLTVGGRPSRLGELLERLGLGFEGCRAIDGFELPAGRFAVRYYDPEEQRVVAVEFDAALRYQGEMRVDVAEWVGLAALATGALATGAVDTHDPPAPGQRPKAVDRWGGDGGGLESTSS